jgi:hypothetical protein
MDFISHKFDDNKKVMVEYHPGRDSLPHFHVWLEQGNRLFLKDRRLRDLWPVLMAGYRRALKDLGMGHNPGYQKPTAEQIARYYRLTKAPRKVSLPERPSLANLKCFPPLPGGVEFLTDREVQNWVREYTSAAVEANKEIIDKRAFYIRTFEMELERQNLELFLEQRKALKIKACYQDSLCKDKSLVGISLSQILQDLYQARAIEPMESGGRLSFEDRATVFKSGKTAIEVYRLNWRDLQTKAEGSGAISLVRHLSQKDTAWVVKFLLERFPYKLVRGSLAYAMVLAARERVLSRPKPVFKLPPADETTWSPVRRYLSGKFKIPEEIIDNAHREGRIFSVRTGVIVFNCDQNSGMFFMPPHDPLNYLPYLENPLPGSRPFLLPGPGKSLLITDNPVEALTLKAFCPECAVLAVGWHTVLSELTPYLEGHRLIVALRRDEGGKAKLARLTRTLTADRLRPPKELKSWNEFWQKSGGKKTPVI